MIARNQTQFSFCIFQGLKFLKIHPYGGMDLA